MYTYSLSKRLGLGTSDVIAIPVGVLIKMMM
jgi:hypothetical protein